MGRRRLKIRFTKKEIAGTFEALGLGNDKDRERLVALTRFETESKGVRAKWGMADSTSGPVFGGELANA